MNPQRRARSLLSQRRPSLRGGVAYQIKKNMSRGKWSDDKGSHYLVFNALTSWDIHVSKQLERTRVREMIRTKTFEIKNKLGLHARAAAKIVNVSRKYKARIYFERDGRVVNGKSLLSILTLACPMGSRVTIRAEGADAQEALQELEMLIEDKFGED